MPKKYFLRITLGMTIFCSCVSGGAASAMSEKLNCGKLGILSIIDNESRGRSGKYKGVISAPALGLNNYPVTMNIGGNWWAAEGYKISVFAGADGYFAKTNTPANAKFFDGKEVACNRVFY